MSRTGPLRGSYGSAVLLVVFALIPYLALTSAITPLTPILSKQIGLSTQALQLTSGMANAAYAFGTVLAVQFAQHLRQRRMLLLYVSMFIVASVCTALAFTPGFFIAGHILQGLLTSLMLIAAVPPLVIGWPARKLPITGSIMTMCIFGAVAAGPVIGGVQAQAAAWKPLFWIVAGCGAVALLFVLLTWEDQPPQDTSAPWDIVALLLAGFGCGAAFFGASELDTHPFLSIIVFIPLVAGIGLIVALVAHQYTAKHPLMPVRQMATTKPIAGIIVALSAGAASVAAIELLGQVLSTGVTPWHAARLFWPEVGGAVLSAGIFGGVLRTRFMPLLPWFGLMVIAGGAAIAVGVATGPHALILVGSGLLGFGVGSAVAPALFVAGFSVRNQQLQRVFALVELLRAVAAFMAAPVVLHLAMTVNGGVKGSGIDTAMWVCFGIAAAGVGVSFYVWILGRARLEKPFVERWESGEGAAWDTPALLAGVRRPLPSSRSLGPTPSPRTSPPSRRGPSRAPC